MWLSLMACKNYYIHPDLPDVKNRARFCRKLIEIKVKDEYIFIQKNFKTFM